MDRDFRTNPFLRLGGEEWKTPKGKLYATFEQAAPLPSGLVRVRLSATSAETFDRLVRSVGAPPHSRTDIADLMLQLPIYLIEVDLSVPAIRTIASGSETRLGDEHQDPSGVDWTFEEIGGEFERLEHKWLILEVTGGGGAIRALLYANLFGEAREIRLASVREAGASVADDLDDLDPLASEPDASESDIESALTRTKSSGIDGIAFYDVGQGTAQGLLNQGQVLAYVDFGGGAGSHSGTFPSSLSAFCFTADPPIVLSHWDEDHWSSGGRDTRSYSQTWIAPRPTAGMKLGFHHRAHASAVLAAGTLLLWPAGLAVLYNGQLTILKCTGSSRNASGLALEVSPPGSGKPVLLPADAGYADLPSPYAATAGGLSPPPDPYDAIACPHHGGYSRSPIIPGCPASTYARLAYSYGVPNQYSHPLSNTWTAHDAAGWADKRAGGTGPYLVLNTENRGSGPGHIGFAWGSGNPLPHLPCRGTQCQLQTAQS